MIISLINRIIRIPATCKVIMQGEAEENILIKIPKKLLADDEEKNKVFLISQLNDSEQVEEELTCSFVDEYDNNCYYWNLKEEYTLEEGKLEIQIKIERGEKQEPEEPELPEQPKDELEWGWNLDDPPTIPFNQEQWSVYYTGYNKMPISIIILDKDTLEPLKCVRGNIFEDDHKIELRFYPSRGDYIIFASSMDGKKLVSKELSSSGNDMTTRDLEIDFENNEIKVEIDYGQGGLPPIEGNPNPPIEGGEGIGLVSLVALNDIENENTEENENESESEEKDPDFEPTPDGEMDPDYLVPYGNNNNGVWYSYKNYFIINKSLISK